MLNRLKCWAWQAEDWLRYCPFFRNRLAGWKLLRDAWSRPRSAQERVRSLVPLTAAARLTNRPDRVARIMGRIHQRLAGLDLAAVDWSEFAGGLDHRRLEVAELLKAPLGEREKGVLFVAFEFEWARLLRHVDLRELARRYDVVLAPSSSPPHNVLSYAFPAAFPGPVFTLISDLQDIEVLPRIAANYQVVPLFASSWALPELFRPRPRQERDIDLIMVANFARFKRHHALFRALRKLPRSWRVVLIGQDQDGRTADTIRAIARAYGVEERIDVLSSAPYEVVSEHLSRARASVVLSRREGSCVVIAESLFANTPAALLEGAEVGSAAFINPQTGRFLRPGHLTDDLLTFVSEVDRHEPRRWAENNITCFHSSAVLNAALKEHALKSGRPWTQDIAPLCWRPFPRLVNAEQRQQLRPAREAFQAAFGLGIGPEEQPQ
jgi:glycosyltransferase involved in cell wall biosynthesis